MDKARKVKIYLGPKGVKNSSINIIPHPPLFDADFETIERKGIGHPDTICDQIAAELSKAYANYTVEHCDGLILHHQFDKTMLIGGHAKVYFGGGEFLSPIQIIIAGRITTSYKNLEIPIQDIIDQTLYKYFGKYFPSINFQKDVKIQNFLTTSPSPGTITTSTGSIADHLMFSPKKISHVKGYERYIANDTSYCISYFPLSPLEQAVTTLESRLMDEKTHKLFPWLGSDIKIMAVRNYDKVSITICIPQIASYVKSLNEYYLNLELISKFLTKEVGKLLTEFDVDISINTKDDYKKFNVYLTVAGSSLNGDIGVVGRGNRTNGLITSNRPMSMEGTNGKNPRYYAGFVYAAFTKQLSKKIYETFNEPNIVEVVSQNGGEILNPWQIRVVCAADKSALEKMVTKELESIPELTSDFLAGKILLN